jgi:diguanylate cyclase (GGDEF)-like protein
MSRSPDFVVTRLDEGERRIAEAEERCNHYREAFLHLLQESFTDLDSTLNRLLEVLATTLDVDRVSFWTFENDHEAIRCTHQFNRTPPRTEPTLLLRQTEYPSYFAAVARQLVIDADDASRDERTSELSGSYLRPLGITSMLDVPVRAFGRYVGILCHENIETPRSWSLEDQNFASGVATQFALAFEREHARRAQAGLLQRSLHDPATHLPNRLNLENILGESIAAGREPLAVAIASVDQYQFVIATLGRHSAEELLHKVAERMVAAAPPGSVVARLAPGEFALLIRGRTGENSSTEAKHWQQALQAPFSAGGEKLFLTFSVGLTYRGTGNQSNAEQVLTEARLALLEAENHGGNRLQQYTSSMRARIGARSELEQELRRGLEANEFLLFFQPVVDLRSGACISSEALLRWRHPVRGIIGPSDFMQVSIESGVMLELGRRVIRSACESIAQIRRQSGLQAMTISVNMSSPEILLPGTAELIYAELARANVPPEALTIEITESVLMTDLKRAREALLEIKRGGVHVGLDDFGTAFSSLSWLRWLPIDTIKIDRSFVAGVPTDQRNTAIVRAIVDLARTFEHSVVAEGIESQEQLNALRELGIQRGQGFLFASPQPVEAFTQAWLRSIALAV